jgi:membrane-bound lytic murein transglycosylase A
MTIQFHAPIILTRPSRFLFNRIAEMVTSGVVITILGSILSSALYAQTEANPPAPSTPPASTVTLSMVAAPATCTPCQVCPVCTADTVEPQDHTLTPSEAPRGRLEKANWADLTDWDTDDASSALTAFEQGCSILRTRSEWLPVCDRASALVMRKFSRTDASDFFKTAFTPYRVVNANDSVTGTVTGYYEPLLRGSRTRTDEFRYPIYSAPQDMVSIDLSEVYPDLKHRRLRGRLVDNKLIPYYDRSEIDSPSTPLKGLEIVWVDNAVELFFLQIQGSGQIQLPDGSRIRLGYADQNGHPFRSLGGLLIRRGELRAHQASMQGIKAWAARNPKKVQRYMNGNPSYVFFKEIPNSGTGPIGTLGVPLTAERSIAVDARVIPLGVPVFLSTTFPGSDKPLNRLMVAQDTGGAIAGGVRVDFYWGFGDEAGAIAGRMKQQGMKWVLLPNGVNP